MYEECYIIFINLNIESFLSDDWQYLPAFGVLSSFFLLSFFGQLLMPLIFQLLKYFFDNRDKSILFLLIRFECKNQN